MPSFVEEHNHLSPNMTSIKNWISSKMGGHNSKAAFNRKHLMQMWTTLYDNDTQLIDNAISEAWLQAAELTPTWVWALVDLPETMHALHYENQRFVNMVQDVREFFHTLIKVHRCDVEMIKTLSFRLGSRHVKYMNDGHDAAYWHPFATQLPKSMVKAYFDVVNNDSKLRRILRIRAKGEKGEEEELIDSWRNLMNMIVESMKRGYEGCPTEKTALRLSLTNSIISMASVRSSRSRSACHFLDPTYSNHGSEEKEDESPSTSPINSSFQGLNVGSHHRSRSIFRSRPTRTSQELQTLRRLSSPNNPFHLQPNDFQILRLSDRRQSVRDTPRKSISLLANQ